MRRALFILIALVAISNSLFAQIVNAQKGENGKYGFVDKRGNWVVQPIYSFCLWMGEYGIFNEKSYAQEGMVNRFGEVIVPCKYDNVFAMYHPCNKHYKINLTNFDGTKAEGVIDEHGKEILPCVYKFIMYKKGNYFVESEDGKGLYDKKGKVIIPIGQCPEIYDVAGIPYIFGGSIVDGGYVEATCVVDTLGNDIIPVAAGYSSVKTAADNIFLVKKDGKYGYYANGTEIIPCQYDEATIFKNDVATVKKDGQVKLIKNPLKDGSGINIASSTPTPSGKKKDGPAQSRYPAPNSDVDKDIPATAESNENTFAFIIANENYPDAPVPYALNDGRIFKEYCAKTLGIPEKNISLYEDATFGSIIAAVEKMKGIADAYEGEASVVFYYAGHGFPDEKQSTAYLLPVDGNASDITATGYSLGKLYKEMSAMKLKSVVVFLDACFSGAKREDDMLASSRGVAIKVKEEAPQGSMIVFSAAQGDETAHQLAEKGHGLFTYYLLKGLQQSGGDINLGYLSDYVTKQVKRQSVVINNKKQTPTVIPSASVAGNWRTMKLK